MTDQLKSAVGMLAALHIIVRRILSGDKTVSEKEVNFVRDYVKERGLDGIFKTPEEMYPKYKDLSGAYALLKDVFNLGDVSDIEDSDEEFEDEDGVCYDEDRITEKLDAGQYVEVDEYDFGQYFMRMLEKVRSIEDLTPVLEKSLLLEPVYKDCQDEMIPLNLSSFIGDLYFAMGRYDDALERYTHIYEAYKDANTGLKDIGLIEILNACYMAGKQPPTELMSKCCWYNSYYGAELINECGDYRNQRFMVEFAKYGNDFFEWAKSQGEGLGPDDLGSDTYGVFDCMSDMSDRETVKVRKRLGLKPFLDFPHMKAVESFSEVAYAEVKLILRLQREFKDKNFVLDKWCEKLEWLEAFQTSLPYEEVVFGYHTPWTWKFSFDLFFPSRQLAIVFHLPDEYDYSVFKDGMAGKLQHMKEWNRVVAKACKSYGINLAYVPVTHDKSDLCQLLESCESGSFSII